MSPSQPTARGGRHGAPLATSGSPGDTRGMTARWIVGIDGSQAALDALRWAVGHGADRDVDVTALGSFHVPALMAAFTAKRGFGVDEIGLAATTGHDVDVAIESVAEPGSTCTPWCSKVKPSTSWSTSWSTPTCWSSGGRGVANSAITCWARSASTASPIRITFAVVPSGAAATTTS